MVSTTHAVPALVMMMIKSGMRSGKSNGSVKQWRSKQKAAHPSVRHYVLCPKRPDMSWGATRRKIGHSRPRTLSTVALAMFESVESDNTTYYFQSVLYKPSQKSDWILEERTQYCVSSDGSKNFAVGGRTYLVRESLVGSDGAHGEHPKRLRRGRDGRKIPPTRARMGKVVHELNSVEKDGPETSSALGGSIWESSHALVLLILISSRARQLLSGQVLELGCGIGLTGILSSIAAGIQESRGETCDLDKKSDTTSDSVAPASRLPSNLDRLVLTDCDHDVLDIARKNCQMSHLPLSKLDVEFLDWNDPPAAFQNKFQTILGTDLCYDFPSVRPLSRTVGYCLRAAARGCEKDGDDLSQEPEMMPTFLHIGPYHRENLADLQRMLESGYLMDVSTDYLELERLLCKPVALNESSAESDEVCESRVQSDGTEYMEVEDKTTLRYLAIIATHSPEYSGDNGDSFFPAESEGYSSARRPY